MSAELFLKASRNKYRFESNKGALSSEDLWDLNLEGLNKVALNIDDQIQQTGKKSFIDKVDPLKNKLIEKLDIVLFVIKMKQEEIERAKIRAEKRQARETLETLLEEKRLAALRGLSTEELEKKIRDLEDA